MSKLKEYLEHYKWKLERRSNENNVQQIIEKLSKVGATPDLLMNTGIYHAVRSIVKSCSDSAQIALPLYNKWKLLIISSMNSAPKSADTSNSIPSLSRVSEPPENHVSETAKTNILINQPTDFRNGFKEIMKNTVTVTDNSLSDKPFSYVPSMNDGGLTNRNSTPAKPPVNKFQPLNNNSNSSFSAHNLNISENSEQKIVSGLSFKTTCNALKSPHSSNSQNAVDGPLNTASPGKIGKIPDPYKIEMKEGMFRAVKSEEALTPDILRVRQMYNREDISDPCDSAPEKDMDKIIEKQNTPRKVDPKNIKSVKALLGKKSAEKNVFNVKSKHSTPERGKSNNKANFEKPFKSEKSRSDSPLNKSAIEKLKLDKKMDKPTSLSSSDDTSPFKISFKTHKDSPNVKSNIKGSPKIKVYPVVKSSIKGSPTVKSSTKGSPTVKSNSKGSPAVKSSSSGSPTVKSNIKESPTIKSNIKGSPTVKSNIKGSPTVKSNIKESPVKSHIKGSPTFNCNANRSPTTKPNIKGSPTMMSNIKGSPTISVNHVNSSSPCDIKRAISSHKDCDKKTNKVLLSRELVQQKIRPPDDSSESFISSKKDRTSMYSGKKTIQEVPSLRYRCVKVLRKNVDRIKSSWQVPYDQLKPVLQYCPATQLRKIEEINPKLLKDTEELWKTFCLKRFRDLKPVPPGTWRELYWRTRGNEDKKIKDLTASISAAKLKAAPERQMAYIESPGPGVIKHINKKIKLSIAELKEAAASRIAGKESSTHKNPSKESLIYKASSKESSSLKISSKESNLSSNKVSSKESNLSSNKVSSKESNLSSNKVSSKESNLSSNKVSSKESNLSSSKVSSKESNLSSNKVSSSSSSHKKAKKAPVAPLMSKVKKSVGLYAMQKK